MKENKRIRRVTLERAHTHTHSIYIQIQTQNGRKTYGVNGFRKSNMSRNKNDSYIINNDTEEKLIRSMGK